MSRFRILFAATSAIFCIFACSAEKLNQPIYRLPDDVIPRAYNVKIAPKLDKHLENFTFIGEVEIDVEVKRSTNIILLNSHQLDILSVEIFYRGGKIPFKYSLEPDLQILRITTNRKVRRNRKVVLKIQFRGVQNDEMRGFYGTKYDHGGEPKWLATTQSEPAATRMIFPCFDEAKFRATFSIYVSPSSGNYSDNITLLKPISPSDPLLEKYTWNTTHTSTQSISFVAGEYSKIFGSKKLEILSRASDFSDLIYPYDMGLALLEHMDAFFMKTRIMPDTILSLLGMPDIGYEAAKRWELKGHRQSRVLFNKKFYTEQDRELVAKTIAHEIAHRWFGENLIPEWWDFLWLDKGFATFFEYYLINEEEPSWKMDEKFVVEAVHEALAIDGIDVRRSLTTHVKTYADIEELYDGITYYKAAAILRMVEKLMGRSTFRNAIDRYVRIGYFFGGLVTPKDLYEAMDEEMRIEKRNVGLSDNRPISSVMNAYTEQDGYPYLLISGISRGNSSDIIVTQIPYVRRSSHSANQQKDERLWPVPLSFTKQSAADFYDTQPKFWSYKEKLELKNIVGKNEWFIFNVQQTSYCRINYNLLNWIFLIDQLRWNHLVIHPINRAQLIDDACTLSMEGDLSFEICIRLLTYLEKENDAIPWYTGLRQLKKLIKRYEGSKYEENLRLFARKTVNNMYNKVGFKKNNSHSQPVAVLQSSLVLAACEWEIEDAIKTAQEIYSSSKDLHKIHPDVKEAVLCVAIKSDSSSSTWDKLWSAFKASREDVEKRMILRSLACTTNEALLGKYLYKLVETDENIGPEHVYPGIQAVTSSFKGISASLTFIRELLPIVNERNKRTLVVMLKLLLELKSKVVSTYHFNRVEDIIADIEKMSNTRRVEMKMALYDIRKLAIPILELREKTIAQLSGALVGKITMESTSDSKIKSSPESASTTSKPRVDAKPKSSFLNFFKVLPSWFTGKW